jgi:hypothetical protein
MLLGNHADMLFGNHAIFPYRLIGEARPSGFASGDESHVPWLTKPGSTPAAGPRNGAVLPGAQPAVQLHRPVAISYAGCRKGDWFILVRFQPLQDGAATECGGWLATAGRRAPGRRAAGRSAAGRRPPAGVPLAGVQLAGVRLFSEAGAHKSEERASRSHHEPRNTRGAPGSIPERPGKGCRRLLPRPVDATPPGSRRLRCH